MQGLFLLEEDGPDRCVSLPAKCPLQTGKRVHQLHSIGAVTIIILITKQSSTEPGLGWFAPDAGVTCL